MIESALLNDTHSEPSIDDVLAFVRAYAKDARVATGELLADHAEGTTRIVQTLNVDPHAVAASALFVLAPHLDDPDKVIAEHFGAEVQRLVGDVRKLLRLGTLSSRGTLAEMPDNTRDAQAARRAQVESMRKILLAFAQDIRVVRFAWARACRRCAITHRRRPRRRRRCRARRWKSMRRSPIGSASGN